jgi:hypothetical protein
MSEFKKRSNHLNTSAFIDLLIHPSIVILDLLVQTGHDSIAGFDLGSRKSGSCSSRLELEMGKYTLSLI